MLRNSDRRRQQLLILCYHGISIDDEHEWAPGLYMSPELFAARLELLRSARCAVLPLDDAVRRLAAGTLPPRSVAITFDDGTYDFHARAWPLLAAHGLPATVYLTTYYCDNNLPVFPLAASYVLWKGRGARISFPLATGARLMIETGTADGRRRAQNALQLHAQDEGFSAEDKDELTERLADALGVDFGTIRRRRILHLMNRDEIREIAGAGVDIELHTHRHRSPQDQDRYRAEIVENRERVEAITGRPAKHFCYPSGVRLPAFEGWLRAEGVESATTCEAGMAMATTNPLRLPRLLDHSDTTSVEFEAWLSGLGALLPRRAVATQQVDGDGRPVIHRPAPALGAAT